MVADDDTGKHIDNAQDKKMPVTSLHIPVFNVHLPELARSCNDSVLRQLPGMLKALLTLGLQDIQRLTQPVAFLVIELQLVLVPQALGQEFVPVHVLFSSD
jgi:hypothetical protein